MKDLVDLPRKQDYEIVKWHLKMGVDYLVCPSSYLTSDVDSGAYLASAAV